jgi:fucose permease
VSSTRALSAAAYAGMFVFGIVMAVLGAVMPQLSDRLAFGLAKAGDLFLVMNFCMLVTSLVLGVAMDRFGMKPPLAAAPWLVAAALLLIARSSQYRDLIPAVVCLGIGGGALNGATNTLIADLHDEARAKASALNLLGVFFGFGALFLPFTLGALLTRLGTSGLLSAVGVACGAAGLYALTLRFPAPKHAHALPIVAMPRFLKQGAVLAMAFLLFFQSGNEFLLGGYFATFVTRELNAAAAPASYILAAYWAAIMAARIALSRVLLRYNPHSVILWSALVSACGALIVASGGTLLAATAGIVLTGLALAGIFPTLLGIAGSDFREHSGTVFGILFTVALSGRMLMPWTAGQIAEAAGLRYVFLLAGANFLAIAVLNAAVGRLRR